MMLNFLRKHQRFFFIIITAAIVVSFSFFGTYSAMNTPTQVEDKELFKGVCGKPIKKQECAALCRLLESSVFSRASWERGTMPNFFNDGVIEKDFLINGLGVLLAKRYFDELKTDLDLRVKKIQHFRPYVHPRATQISVEAAWMRFSPQMMEHFRAIKARSDQSTTETLAVLAQLYLDQVMLPPDTLRQILQMQENQQGIEPDPVLANTDLSLFGFKSLEDWFGPRLVPLIAQFILNAAQLAEEKGYQIKTEEIRAELYQNIATGYQQVARNSNLNPEEMDQYFQTNMRHLGLDENQLLSSWKKVMLFRRLFEDGSGSVLVDPLAYQQFDKYAKEQTRISLYQLPAALQLGDFRSLLKLQIYLEQVVSEPSRLRTDLLLPRQFASLETIEKRAPDLVERQYELEWAGVSKEELARSISVKETWEWEAADAHWDLLRKQFSELAAFKATSKSERLAALDTLEKKLRLKVDQYARQKMVDEHPEHIQAALAQSTVNNVKHGITMKGEGLPFAGTAELAALLEQATLKNEPCNTAAQRLNLYTPDGEHFYRIQVLQRDPLKKVLTFEQASKEGALDKLLDKRLEEAYPEIRKRDSQLFQQANGQWRAFKEVKDQVGEVKDQVGKLFYADLLKAIEEHYRMQFGVLPGKAGELPLLFYSNARLLPYMVEAQKHLQANAGDPSWVKGTEEISLANQWALEKTDCMVERCTELPFAKDEMFTLAPAQWSNVAMGKQGALAFYYVLERGANRRPSLEGVIQGHQILAHDAKRDMMLHILKKIQQKKAIDLSVAVCAEESDG
jgi:GcvH upstream region-like protein